jgi:predicted O-methyltransferase YrrM
VRAVEVVPSMPRLRIILEKHRTDTIYDRPRDYDLEHKGDDEDVRFYVELVKMLHARRVLELGAGSGRVTLPLAQVAAALSDAAQGTLKFVCGDLREWKADEPFDLILTHVRH